MPMLLDYRSKSPSLYRSMWSSRTVMQEVSMMWLQKPGSHWCNIIDTSCITVLDRSEEHTSELQSRLHLVCRLLLEKKNILVSVGPVSCLATLVHSAQSGRSLSNLQRISALPIAQPAFSSLHPLTPSCAVFTLAYLC